jgi:hypothetical protein
LKVVVEPKKHMSPICQHDLEELRYTGNNPDILAVFGSRRRGGERMDFWADAVEDERDVWSVVIKHGFGDYE